MAIGLEHVAQVDMRVLVRQGGVAAGGVVSLGVVADAVIGARRQELVGAERVAIGHALCRAVGVLIGPVAPPHEGWNRTQIRIRTICQAVSVLIGPVAPPHEG